MYKRISSAIRAEWRELSCENEAERKEDIWTKRSYCALPAHMNRNSI